MRIVLDGRIVLPRMTGAGRYVVELARRVPQFTDDLSLDVLLLPSMRVTCIPVMLADAGARIRYVDVPIASFRQWFVIPEILRHMQTDVYHYPFLDLPFVSTPSVVTIYDLNPLLHAEYFDHFRAVKRVMVGALLRSTMARSHAVLAISEITTRLLQERYPDFASKVRTIPLGIDPSRWSATSSNDSNTLVPHARAVASGSRWNSREYALYVGVDRPHKNLVRLLRAFGRFRDLARCQRGQGPYLWLAGVGAGSATLGAEIRVLKLEADVRLAPALSENDLRAAYSGARVVTYVSTSEGFGLPILEAFAAGVPVLAADASSLPEVGGDAAIYANPHDYVGMADALLRIWGDGHLRHTLVERGRERVTRFSWDATAAATVKAYFEVIAANSRRRKERYRLPPAIGLA